MAAPKTFYKYVEREQESRVNWNEVSRDLTTRLKLETADRELRKEEIKQSTRDLINYMENPPAGLNYSLNQQVQNLSSDLIEAVKIQQKLLESGDLSERAFKNIRQNMQDDTENIYRVYKGYNDKFAEYAERQQPGSNANGIDPAASGLEANNMETLEEMHNFKQYAPALDAGTGSISLLKFDDNGQLIKGSGASVKDYLMRQESQYDWFSMEDAEELALQGIATVITSDFLTKKKKGTASVESPKLNEQYETWLNNSTIKIMGDEVQMSKILYDYMKGMPVDNQGNYDPNGTMETFKVTDDPKVKGDNIILRYADPNGGRPLFRPTTDNQKELLKQYVSDRLEARVGTKETLTSDFTARTTSSTTRFNNANPTTVDFVTASADAFVGDSPANYAFYLTNLAKNIPNSNVETVDYSGGNMIFTYKDGGEEFVTYDTDDAQNLAIVIGNKMGVKAITQGIRYNSNWKSKIGKGGKAKLGKGTAPRINPNQERQFDAAYRKEIASYDNIIKTSKDQIEVNKARALKKKLLTTKGKEDYKTEWLIQNPAPTWSDFKKQ